VRGTGKKGELLSGGVGLMGMGEGWRVISWRLWLLTLVLNPGGLMGMGEGWRVISWRLWLLALVLNPGVLTGGEGIRGIGDWRAVSDKLLLLPLALICTLGETEGPLRVGMEGDRASSWRLVLLPLALICTPVAKCW
jgi:hypothetical protein